MSDLTLTPTRGDRLGPDNIPAGIAAARDRLDQLNVEIASIEGNIARLNSMLEDESATDTEYSGWVKQRVHALTAKRYGTVEREWLKAWLRTNDPDTPTRLLRGIFMELVQIKTLLARR